jgi:hypothetical protein
MPMNAEARETADWPKGEKWIYNEQNYKESSAQNGNKTAMYWAFTAQWGMCEVLYKHCFLFKAPKDFYEVRC